MPRVSVVMPSYQKGRYIERAIRSVLDQTFADVELLVQDAGSGDGTIETVRRLARDPRVSLVVKPDRGQADAVNRGFARASGEILSWLNADDELELDALERVVRILEAEPEIELVYGRGAYVDCEGVRLRDYRVRPFDRELLLTVDYVLQPASFWRRRLWERVGPLDEFLTFAFDWDWYIRASRETAFRFLDVDLARYRLTGENKSLVGGASRQRELAAVARRYGGRRQPTYLYWQFCRLRRRVPPVGLLEPFFWRVFRGRIGT